MAQSKAHGEASNRWNAKNYDRICVLVKKGEREKLKAYAASREMSLNGFIKYCIEKEINNDFDLTQS